MNSNTAVNSNNSVPPHPHQKGILLMNQVNQKIPSYSTQHGQSLTERTLPIQQLPQKINVIGNLNNPTLLHQISTSPKPLTNLQTQQHIQPKQTIFMGSGTNIEDQSSSLGGSYNYTSRPSTYQVITVPQRNIQQQNIQIQKQRFYSPTPVAFKNGIDSATIIQTLTNQSTIPKTLMQQTNNKVIQQGALEQQTKTSINTTTEQKQSNPNKDKGSNQVNLPSQNQGEKQVLSEQIQQQQQKVNIPSSHILNTVLKPQIGIPASPIQTNLQSVIINKNNHVRTKTSTLQHILMQNHSPQKNIVTVFPQGVIYGRGIENNLNNISQGAIPKSVINENLTVSQQNNQADLARSKNANVVQINQQSKGYIVNNLIHSTSSPNKIINQQQNIVPTIKVLSPSNPLNVRNAQPIANIDQSQLSPEARKLYDIVGKYNNIISDEVKTNENIENKKYQHKVLNISQQSVSSSQLINRSLTPQERFTFGQKEVKVISPIISQIVYPSQKIETRVVNSQIVSTVPVLPNQSILEAQKSIHTPISHSLEARTKKSENKSAHSSRCASHEKENKNNLSMVIEVGTEQGRRRVIEGSPVRSKSPGVIQGSPSLINNAPTFRTTHFYKKGNKTLTIEEVMEEKRKASIEASRYMTEYNQSERNNLSPLRYDKFVSENQDQILYDTENTVNKEGYVRNNLHSVTNQKYSTPGKNEQIQEQKHQIQRESELRQSIDSQLLQESLEREAKLKEQYQRQQQELLQQQKIIQQQRLSQDSKSQQQSKKLETQKKVDEKKNKQPSQEKQKRMNEKLQKQQAEQQKVYEQMQVQQLEFIKKENENQKKRELEQQKQIETSKIQFNQMYQQQQQMSVEERKQFKEIYAQQQEEVKRLQQSQIEQQKVFAEQISSIINQHNQQLNQLKQEQLQQTNELKEMMLNSSRNSGSNSPSNHQLDFINERLLQEKESMFKQQHEQALQYERQKQELKEREFKLAQEHQQIKIVQQQHQLEELRKKSIEHEQFTKNLQKQKEELENQYYELRSQSDSSQQQNYDDLNQDIIQYQQRKERVEQDLKRNMDMVETIIPHKQKLDQKQKDGKNHTQLNNQSERQKFEQNGDYINLYSTNNSQQKNTGDDEDGGINQNDQEETYSAEVDEEEQQQRIQNQQTKKINHQQFKNSKNEKLAQQLDEIELEIQRLQQEEQQTGNKKKKNLYSRGVVPEENEEEYNSNYQSQNKKTKKSQVIQANNNNEKQQKGGKVYRNNKTNNKQYQFPGQRLYEYALEKNKRNQALKHQSEFDKAQKEIDQCTFNPQLVSSNKQYGEDFYSRNKKWQRQKEQNNQIKNHLEKEKEIKECTFYPEFYSPNKYSSQYTTTSNDPTSIYKRQMEWKSRIDTDINNQKEANDMLIKEKSNEIHTLRLKMSTQLNSPQKMNENDQMLPSGYSSRLNKILSSCKNRNSAKYNDDYQSADQSQYQQYNQSNKNQQLGYPYQYNQAESPDIPQNIQDKGDYLMKSVNHPLNIQDTQDLINHIAGIMKQSNYCDQNIELEQMLTQSKKHDQKSQILASTDIRYGSSSSKDNNKVHSSQISEFSANIKQREIEKLREEFQQNKPIVVTNHPILAERKEYTDVIGNVSVQKNKYVFALQDQNVNQGHHNFSFDNQQQYNQNVLQQYQQEQQINNQQQQQNSSNEQTHQEIYIERIAQNSNDEQEVEVNDQEEFPALPTPKNQNDNNEKVIMQDSESEVV